MARPLPRKSASEVEVPVLDNDGVESVPIDKFLDQIEKSVKLDTLKTKRGRELRSE